jgi:predicted DNA-binding transcriptional regulator AlpA
MDIFLDGEQYLTMKEVEKLVDMKESYIYALVKHGHFPQPTRIEVRRAWKKSDIEAYIESTKNKQL